MDLFILWRHMMKMLNCSQHQDLFSELMLRYQESQRHYHTITHLMSCFSYWQECEQRFQDSFAVALALFYHDAIYDVYRSDNEELSANLWRSHGRKMGLSTLFIEKVAGMVLATKLHKTEDADTQIFLDIDLSILGEQEEAFDQFECAIRSEYQWVPEDMFRNRREQILREFLERDQIFYTPSFHSFERQARKNLSRRIVELERTPA
ncbi:hypothetical protein HYV70_01510 [Candidatus Uhrbacteria bacterium]|nr:hypothetical protein [Candidatus Uhrbacteria bacterium]